MAVYRFQLNNRALFLDRIDLLSGTNEAMAPGMLHLGQREKVASVSDHVRPLSDSPPPTGSHLTPGNFPIFAQDGISRFPCLPVATPAIRGIYPNVGAVSFCARQHAFL